jgi:VWFA-related protein
MRMVPKRVATPNTTGKRRKAAAAVLAIAAIAVLLAALRTPAQQNSSPAAPSPPAPANNATHPDVNPGQTTGPAIVVNVPLVNVPVTALNKRAQPIIDLNQEEFQIFEDNVEQKITHFERETSTPLRVGLIVDTSNSSRARLPYEKDAAQEFIYMALGSGGTKNQVFLQTSDSANSIVQEFTNDPDVLNEKLQNLKSGGGKALYDAIYATCKDKMRQTGPPEGTRRVLIVLSDGLDVQSQHTLDEAISMARMAETMIFTISTAAYGYTNPGDKLLADISSQTGGYPSFPLRETSGTDLETGYLSHGQIGDSSQNKGLGAETGKFSADRLIQLADSMQAVGRNLDEQYSIGYRPSREVMDGTYRTIKVVCSRRGVTLRWKPGYFARPE